MASDPARSAAKPSLVNLRDPYIAAFLAWLVPGLGHLYQGRRGKAALYAVCILGLFATGFIFGEGKIVLWRWLNPMRDSENFQPWYLGQFWTGLVALPALIQATLIHWGRGVILGGWMAEPQMEVLNGLHQRGGKLVEIGKIYTTIAGLLNLLAIFDAYEGPADGGVPATVNPKPVVSDLTGEVVA